VFFKLRFDLLLQLRYFLPHIGKNIFEVFLKFSSQTQFEFFTIHFIFPPYVENTALFWDETAGGFE